MKKLNNTNKNLIRKISDFHTVATNILDKNKNTYMEDLPVWISLYDNTQLEDSWYCDVISRYPEDLIKNTEVRFEIDNLLIKSKNGSKMANYIINNINVCPKYTKTEYLIFVIDVIKCFANSIPNSDKDIYSFYREIRDLKGNVEYDFADFYAAVRSMKYTDLDEMSMYKGLKIAKKDMIYETSPVPGIKWKVNIDDTECTIKILEILNKESNNFVDSPVKAEVIKSDDDESLEPGEEIRLYPNEINQGEMINFKKE